ncbi:MAG: hypothetical protein J5980_03155 [Muribaculaceae bacterium]|nr:hypothetical protein [Muribaculaceae bacterium]
MKKFFLFSVLALVAILNINAQDGWKHEIGITYGFGAFTDLNSSYLDGMLFGKQTNYIGAFGAEYFYRPKSAFGVGLVATFGTCKWNNDLEKSRSKYFSVMPAVKYNWLNRERFSMYSKAAVGLLIGRDSDGLTHKTEAAFIWQASAVGAEYGTAFRGFLELGYGEQGILVAGLKYKF